MAHRDFNVEQEGTVADIDQDVQAPARQKFPTPLSDQIGREVGNSPYGDTVKLLKADNEGEPLGGDVADIGEASKGQGRRE